MLQKISPNLSLPLPVFGGPSGQSAASAKPKTKRDQLRAALSAMIREELSEFILLRSLLS